MQYKNIAGRFFGLVTKHACDRQTRETDRLTDRITTPKTAPAQHRAVKTDVDQRRGGQHSKHLFNAAHNNCFYNTYSYISHEAQPRQNVQWSQPSVFLSVPRRIPTLLNGDGCKLGGIVEGALQLCNNGRICNRCTGFVAMTTQRRTRNVSKRLYLLYDWFIHLCRYTEINIMNTTTQQQT